MEDEVILKVENLFKQYRLGNVGTGTISHDLNRFFAKIRGKEDPYLKIGESNDRSKKAKSDYVWALKDINFEVKRGEILGIIGKNGAGKSTLLKILSKVTSPTQGSIKSKGRIASLLEVGTGFHPEMTGKENIFLNGAILGMTKKEIASKLDEIIQFSGCDRYIDTPVKRYSSGMKVRLAFAVAAHLEPDILVVDEVLAVGDAEFQKKAIGKMQDISKTEGRTVLFVSHDMAAIKSLCQTTIILHNGKIISREKTNLAIKKYIEINANLRNINLESRIDRRKGNEVFMFTNIFFNKENPVFSGESLHVTLSYKSKIDVKNINIAVTICKEFGDKILTLDTIHQNKKIKILKGAGKIYIILPKLYLLPDTYIVNLWSEYNNEVLDKVLNCAELIVHENDVFKTGKILNSNKHGIIFPDLCIWNSEC